MTSYNSIIDIRDHIKNLLKPYPKMNFVEWMKRYRVMPKTSSFPGRYTTDIVPWVEDWAKAFSNPNYRGVVLMTGSQLSKTESELGIIGMTAMLTRKPVLFYLPDENLQKSVCKSRLEPMIESIEELWSIFNRKKSSIGEYYLGGVPIMVGFAGSNNQLSSRSAPIILADEIDRYPIDRVEGDPLKRMFARFFTYSNVKYVLTSTPTLGFIQEYKHEKTGLIHWQVDDKFSGSPIWKNWQEGTKHEFMVPCPHCGVFFTLKSTLLVIPDKLSMQSLRENVGVKCPHCDNFIHRTKQKEIVTSGKSIAPGQWVENDKVVGDLSDTDIYSQYTNGLNSLFANATWLYRAMEYGKAKISNSEKDKVSVLNTHFGELSGKLAQEFDWRDVLPHILSNYKKGTLPHEGISVLTLGADVQGDRIYYSVHGWHVMPTSLDMYVIDYGCIYGDTYDFQVWNEFTKVCLIEYGGLPISFVAVDAGYNPTLKSVAASNPSLPRNMVYEYKRRNPGVILTRGASRPMTTLFKRSFGETSKNGHYNRGIDFWYLDTGTLKRELVSKYTEKETNKLFIPQDVSEDFILQITSEYEDEKTGLWKFVRANHYFDTLVIGLFLAAFNNYFSSMGQLDEMSNEEYVDDGYDSNNSNVGW